MASVSRRGPLDDRWSEEIEQAVVHFLHAKPHPNEVAAMLPAMHSPGARFDLRLAKRLLDIAERLWRSSVSEQSSKVIHEMVPGEDIAWGVLRDQALVAIAEHKWYRSLPMFPDDPFQGATERHQFANRLHCLVPETLPFQPEMKSSEILGALEGWRLAKIALRDQMIREEEIGRLGPDLPAIADLDHLVTALVTHRARSRSTRGGLATRRKAFRPDSKATAESFHRLAGWYWSWRLEEWSDPKKPTDGDFLDYILPKGEDMSPSTFRNRKRTWRTLGLTWPGPRPEADRAA